MLLINYQSSIVFLSLYLYLFAHLINIIYALNIDNNDNKDKGDKGIPTDSIVDLLSSNSTYSHLLLTLQKSDLIDYVNELQNITFLAPINEAFEKYNIPLGSTISKDELNRFIIDNTIFRDEFNGIKIDSTLNFKGSPYIKDFQIPILLDYRFDSNNNNNNEIYFIENANVISDDQYLPTINSIVLTIDNLLLDPKESICRYFFNSLNRDTGFEHFKTFSSLLLSDSTCKSMKMSNLTFLLPSDNSLDLNHVEKKYLYHIRGLADKNLFISNFLIDGLVGGNFENNSILKSNWNNEILSLSSSYLGDEIIINNNTHSTTSNYLLSDGIIHYFENKLFDYNDPKKFPVFTPRKYLIGLDYEDFVDEIDFRGLSNMIDNNSLNQTIFVSNDYKILGSLKNQMLYHFTLNNNEIIQNSSEIQYKLLDSKFCIDTNNNNNNNIKDQFCQKIKFEISPYGEMTLNSNSKILNSIPYKVGNTSIFIIDDDISTPPKLQTAIASELTGYGKSISFMKKFNYSKKLSKDDSIYTIFLPATQIWNSLDLTLDYLIENPKLLQKILDNLIIKDVIYHDFEGSKEFETYSSSKIEISKIDLDENNLLINNLTNISISFDTEILYSNGVIHPITDNLPLPPDLKISNLDLLSSQDSSEFQEILKLLNLTSVLDSTKGYSIMLPSSNSLLQENITHLLSDLNYLEKFAKLHILPPGSLDLILDCYSGDKIIDEDDSFTNLHNGLNYNPNLRNFSTLIPTLLNDTHLTCRELASGGMMLSITEGSKNEVRILRHGNAIDNSTINSGLLLLDRPLNPNWLNKTDDKLYLHLPLFAILVGILIGIVCVLLTCGCCLMLAFGNSKKRNDPDNDLINEDERIDHVISVNERMPLLHDDEDNSNNYGSSNDDNNSKSDGNSNHFKRINVGNDNFTGDSNANLSNGHLINGTRNQLRSYNSTGLLGKSLGREAHRNNNNNNSIINNENLNNYNSPGGKGRKIGRRYSTFDARYSMHASASPIDVNQNNENVF